MFPLVHLFTYQSIAPGFCSLAVLGGLFPDLAHAAGGDRNTAHSLGKEFYLWCQDNAADALPFARGVLVHGSEPAGIDYYADEAWPGGRRGWCFQKGEPYTQALKAASHLPDDLLYWKAHNFVEMAAELSFDKQYPYLGRQIIAATEDKAAVTYAAELVNAFCGLDKNKMAQMLQMAPVFFALDPVTPLDLAAKQARQYSRRFGVADADEAAMAALIEQIASDTAADFTPFYQQTLKQVRQTMRSFF